MQRWKWLDPAVSLLRICWRMLRSRVAGWRLRGDSAATGKAPVGYGVSARAVARGSRQDATASRSATPGGAVAPGAVVRGERDDGPVRVGGASAGAPGIGRAVSNRALAEAALAVARGQVGVRETARNRGPEVDAYIRSVGLDPAKGEHPWCCAFVFWCYVEAAKGLGVPNPLPRTASVHRLWERSPLRCRTAAPIPGSIFVRDSGSGRGHVGFVVDAFPPSGRIVTVEGNTDGSGSREGDGVYLRSRWMRDVTMGYLDFGALGADS